MKIKASIVGAAGYVGIELIKLLTKHDKVEISNITSESQANLSLIDYDYSFDFLKTNPNIKNLKFQKFVPELVAKTSDVVFLAVAHGEAKKILYLLYSINPKLKIIDLSYDFRIKKNLDKPYDKIITYGLPEMGCREQIKKSQIISNPGCYPTACALSIMPILDNHEFFKPELYIFDAKSGVSGAGKTYSEKNLFCNVNENIIPYKVTDHMHKLEIEQIISEQIKSEIYVQFTPHIIPIDRGILVSTYIKLNKKITKYNIDDIRDTYKTYYKHSSFTKIICENRLPSLKDVIGTNNCIISIAYNEKINTILSFAVIDNLIKGAAGQAIQNMNIMYGLEEDCGLTQ